MDIRIVDSLLCAAAGVPVQRTAYSAPDSWSSYHCVCDQPGVMMSTLGGGT